MTDCRYCTESFSEEDQYLQHLHDDHRNELSRIDQKRIDNHPEIGELPTSVALVKQGLIITAALLLTAALIYIAFNFNIYSL